MDLFSDVLNQEAIDKMDKATLELVLAILEKVEL